MKIHFLDASTLHRNDLDFTPFEAFGDLAFFDQTQPAELIQNASGAEVVVTNKVAFTAADFAQLPQLKLILVAATGYNIIDLDAASQAGVIVCNVAGYSTSSLSQHVMTLLLNLVTQVHRYQAKIHQWPQSPIFTDLSYPIGELSGMTLGLVGLGESGRAVARMAQAFDMKVQALAREGAECHHFIPRLPKEEFFRSSDVISLHCPLTPQTRHLINPETLALMKPSAFLINAGRGPLVDEQALADALKHRRIAGAGLDVLSQEPPSPDHPLLSPALSDCNLIITPHTAWASSPSRQRLLDGLLFNLKNWLEGHPSNQVNA